MYSNFPFMVPGARSSSGDVQTAGAYETVPAKNLETAKRLDNVGKTFVPGA
jgi:hypothetical protein